MADSGGSPSAMARTRHGRAVTGNKSRTFDRFRLRELIPEDSRFDYFVKWI